jgi:hypothetical protein
VRRLHDLLIRSRTKRERGPRGRTAQARSTATETTQPGLKQRLPHAVISLKMPAIYCNLVADGDASGFFDERAGDGMCCDVFVSVTFFRRKTSRLLSVQATWVRLPCTNLAFDTSSCRCGADLAHACAAFPSPPMVSMVGGGRWPRCCLRRYLCRS